MKVEVENLSGHFKKLKFEIPAEKVTQSVDGYYKNLQKEVQVKGFRKGKAPLNMVKEMYKDSATSSIIREIVEAHLPEGIRSNAFAPLSVPQIDVESLSENAPFKFSATFENTPPVELKDYTSLKEKKPEVVVEAKELESTLENIRGQMARFESLETGTPLAVGQVALLDYEARDLAGEVVAAATEKDSFLEIGSGNLHPEFEKNVLGMTVGETKNFSVSFPEAATEEEKTPVSGKTLAFVTTLKDLRRKILPDFTEEVVQQMGFPSVEELKKRAEADIRSHKEQQVRRELQEKVINWLIEKNPVDIPETMMGSQMEQLAMDAGMQLAKMGLDQKAIEDRLKTWAPEMQERATKQVRASLLLGAISKKENIQATDEDIRQEIVRMAQANKQKPQQVWEDLREKQLLQGLFRQLTELKALDWVVDRVSS